MQDWVLQIINGFLPFFRDFEETVNYDLIKNLMALSIWHFLCYLAKSYLGYRTWSKDFSGKTLEEYY